MLKKSVRTFAVTLVALLVGGVALTSASADTGAPTNGQNLGFRFINSPVGGGSLDVHAAFLQADGTGLSMCGISSLGPNTNCTYDFRYSINGTQVISTTQASAFAYYQWPTITDSNKDSVLCRNTGSSQLADNGPHTNFNCFNQNTYGEVFKPASSGSLSGFSMAMTCLSPTGATILTANLYETSTPAGNPNNNSSAFANSTINSTPIASATFTLSSCATSWSGKTFTDADFSYPTMDFGSVSLDSSKWYAVLFTGDAIAGAKPAGAVTAPTTSTHTTKPVIKGKKTSQVLIDTRFVATYSADEKVTWSVSGGKDADLFNIDENGKLRFKKKQTETAKYEVQVSATDSAGNTSESIAVKVEVVKEITDQVATGNTPMSNGTKTAMAIIAIAAAGVLVVSLRKTI